MRRALTALILLAPFAAYAACPTPPVTSGSSGYQSKTRYISAVRANSADTHSLRVSWSYAGGAFGGTSTVDLGAQSGIIVRTGADCTTALGEASPGTGDCAGTIGWESIGDLDRLFTFESANGTAVDGKQVSRILINGIKYLELYNVASNSVTTWHWNDTGMTKMRSDNVGDAWLYLDGYENGALVTKQWHLFGNMCP